MKTRVLPIAAVAVTLALAACGGREDASEDAMADTVEMPADEAMADAPMPVEDPEIADAADEAMPMEQVEEEAMQAAEDAQAAVDDAIAAAEESMDVE